jgi:O-acetyl-ADP-ribose deacetylase (regulator of RNase III)
MFRFIIKQGDAYNNGDLKTPTAHFIANDAGMGAGIANTICRDQGPKIRSACRGAGIGAIIPYQAPGKKPVINMISKEVSCYNPELKDALDTLLNLKAYLSTNKINKLHIPFIGAGIDRLPWFTIEDFILKNFSDLDIEITAFFFNKTELESIIAKSGVKQDDERAKLYTESFIKDDKELVYEKKLVAK